MHQLVREVWKAKRQDYIVPTVSNAHGSTYEGFVLENKPSGYGVLQYTQLQNPIFSRYVGNWLSGKRHGQGTVYVRGEQKLAVQTTWHNGLPLGGNRFVRELN